MYDFVVNLVTITFLCDYTFYPNFCSKFKNSLRTIPALAEQQILKFSIKEQIIEVM